MLRTDADPLLARFVEAALHSFDLSALSIDRDRARLSIRAALWQQYARLNTPSVQETRHRHVAVPNSTPADFAEHVVALDGGRHVLCGIRHMNLNPARPFIHVRADVPLVDVDAVEAIYQGIADRFRVFSPQHVAIDARVPIGDRVGSVHMVQHARTIQARTPWPSEPDLTLRPVTTPGYFAWYQDGYQAFHERHPHLVDLVAVNDRTVMEQSREEGLLYAMMLDGKQAGLIAAVRSDFLGHPGLYFNEIFIAAPYTGRGLAKALQRKFIVQCCPEDALVWGTIDAQNHPSYRTAHANGRLPIQFESFLPIPSGS